MTVRRVALKLLPTTKSLAFMSNLPNRPTVLSQKKLK